MENFRHFLQIGQEIIFIYPFTMAWVWMAGSIFYFLIQEFRRPGPDQVPGLQSTPMVSIIIPCFNESEQIRDTIGALAELNYPSQFYEVIAVNDGSRDDTRSILNQLVSQYDFLKVIHLSQNKGKALALKSGVLLATGEFVVCIDGDALLEPNSVSWLIYYLTLSSEIGGVTGNPRIRNRTTLLGKLQTGEFSSIIGLIKRAQMDYGRLFTISGVVAAFRKQALHQVGYWGADMLTEDIDITWRLQKAGWQVLYAPNALCWILMPETLRGLWHQRLRWAQGGAEIVFKYGLTLFRKDSWRMLPILINFNFAVLWANIVVFVLLCGIIQLGSFFLPVLSHYDPLDLGINTLVPSSWGVLLGLTFLLQSTISLIIEQRYEPGLLRYFGWMIWYPLGYWVIMVFTTFIGFYRALFLGRKKLATWESPDRGLAE